MGDNVGMVGDVHLRESFAKHSSLLLCRDYICTHIKAPHGGNIFLYRPCVTETLMLFTNLSEMHIAHHPYALYTIYIPNF